MSANDNADPRHLCALAAHQNHAGTHAYCNVKVAPEKLMCATHWRRVPRALQTKVYRAWDAYCDERITLEALRAVQDEATAAVVAAIRGTR